MWAECGLLGSGLLVSVQSSISLGANIFSQTATEASPKALLSYNRDHWRIENNAIVLELAASFGLSPKIAIERCQDNKNLAVAWLGA